MAKLEPGFRPLMRLGTWVEMTMKYQCIRCCVTWGEGNPEEEFYSHGLCLFCLKEALTPIYRKRQLAEGNFDCFGKANGSCDQVRCLYRELCLSCS